MFLIFGFIKTLQDSKNEDFPILFLLSTYFGSKPIFRSWLYMEIILG